MRRFLREPLLHFFLGGLLLLGAWSLFARPQTEPNGDGRHIRVEREELIAFVSAKTKHVDDADARRAFDGLDEVARRAWIDRFVREEVLVREARHLGLDRGDEIIRRRLAQKVEFLTLGMLADELRVGDSDLERFYLAHAEDYRLPTTLTFSHVFIRPGADSRARATDMLARLRSEAVSFRDAIGLGDRFLYNRNYVGRTLDEVRSHFGSEIADRLEGADVDESLWTGPFESPHGWHLILLTGRDSSRIPPAAELGGLLRDDVLREKREAALDRAIAKLTERYEIELAADLEPSE